MPKQFIKQRLPSPERIAALPFLRRFEPQLKDPALWHINRRSIAAAMYWGLFCAFLPIPFQMIPAAIGAIYFRANLPLSVALCWISNPLTALPILYVGYALGSSVLQQPMISSEHLRALMEWLSNWFSAKSGNPLAHSGSPRLFTPLLVGLILEAMLVSVIGGTLTRLFWRWHVIRAWRRRNRVARKPSVPVSEKVDENFSE